MTDLPVTLRLKNVTIGDTTTGQFWAGDHLMADILYASPDDAEVVWLLLQPYPAPSPDDERALRIGRAVMSCLEIYVSTVPEVELHGTRHYTAGGLLDALVAAGEVEG